MLGILLSAAIGAYLSQRISVVRDGEIVSVLADYQHVWQDSIALLTFIGAICNWAISTGRSARFTVAQRSRACGASASDACRPD